MKKNYKIMLALDPSVATLRPNSFELAWLRKCARVEGAEIQVVHVSFGNPVAQVSAVEFSNYVTHLHLGKSVVATVIHEKSSSRHKAVESLVEFLKWQESDLLIVSSHGRSGPSRIVLGSFAESLLATSPIPVLFLSDGLRRAKSEDRILFPTDFSPLSHQTLNLLLDHFRGFKGEFILFHAISMPISMLETGIMGMPVYVPENYWEDQQKWAAREIQAMAEKVISLGYRCRTVIHDEQMSPSSSIRNFAEKEGISLIAMASVRVDLRNSILGTVAKDIFRQRSWPVWVCGPETVFNKIEVRFENDQSA